MRRFDLGSIDEALRALRAIGVSSQKVRATVTDVLEDVRGRGDAALRDYTAQLDGVEPASPLSVSGVTLRRALESSPPELVDALAKAAENLREYHSREAPRPWRTQLAQGQICLLYTSDAADDLLC